MHYLGDEFRAVCSVMSMAPSIVHVGAHTGEEAEYYDSLRPKPNKVLWIEANRDLIDSLTAHVERFERQSAFWAFVGAKTAEVIAFHIANNPLCSSALDLQEHRAVYPDVAYVRDEPMATITLDDLLDNWREGRGFFESRLFNVLVMDVQGTEGLVIDGAAKTLRDIQLICTEINFREMYRGCLLIDRFDLKMAEYGFERFATKDSGGGWGDALYRRKVTA